MPPAAAPARPSAPPAGPACRRCGSPTLRRPHSRNGWERYLRRHTRWDRYACAACGDRGWVRQAVPEGDDPYTTAAAAVALTTPGRPLEVRDVRARREAATRALVTVLLALALGALAALFLQRCGAAAPPPAP
jgi:hypothetical protein